MTNKEESRVRVRSGIGVLVKRKIPLYPTKTKLVTGRGASIQASSLTSAGECPECVPGTGRIGLQTAGRGRAHWSSTAYGRGALINNSVTPIMSYDDPKQLRSREQFCRKQQPEPYLDPLETRASRARGEARRQSEPAVLGSPLVVPPPGHLQQQQRKTVSDQLGNSNLGRSQKSYLVVDLQATVADQGDPNAERQELPDTMSLSNFFKKKSKRSKAGLTIQKPETGEVVVCEGAEDTVSGTGATTTPDASSTSPDSGAREDVVGGVSGNGTRPQSQSADNSTPSPTHGTQTPARGPETATQPHAEVTTATARPGGEEVKETESLEAGSEASASDRQPQAVEVSGTEDKSSPLASVDSATPNASPADETDPPCPPPRTGSLSSTANSSSPSKKAPLGLHTPRAETSNIPPKETPSSDLPPASTGSTTDVSNSKPTNDKPVSSSSETPFQAADDASSGDDIPLRRSTGDLHKLQKQERARRPPPEIPSLTNRRPLTKAKTLGRTTVRPSKWDGTAAFAGGGGVGSGESCTHTVEGGEMITRSMTLSVVPGTDSTSSSASPPRDVELARMAVQRAKERRKKPPPIKPLPYAATRRDSVPASLNSLSPSPLSSDAGKEKSRSPPPMPSSATLPPRNITRSAQALPTTKSPSKLATAATALPPSPTDPPPRLPPTSPTPTATSSAFLSSSAPASSLRRLKAGLSSIVQDRHLPARPAPFSVPGLVNKAKKRMSWVSSGKNSVRNASSHSNPSTLTRTSPSPSSSLPSSSRQGLLKGGRSFDKTPPPKPPPPAAAAVASGGVEEAPHYEEIGSWGRYHNSSLPARVRGGGGLLKCYQGLSGTGRELVCTGSSSDVGESDLDDYVDMQSFLEPKRATATTTALQQDEDEADYVDMQPFRPEQSANGDQDLYVEMKPASFCPAPYTQAPSVADTPTHPIEGKGLYPAPDSPAPIYAPIMPTPPPKQPKQKWEEPSGSDSLYYASRDLLVNDNKGGK